MVVINALILESMTDTCYYRHYHGHLAIVGIRDIHFLDLLFFHDRTPRPPDR